jgi:hypothetical protein
LEVKPSRFGKAEGFLGSNKLPSLFQSPPHRSYMNIIYPGGEFTIHILNIFTQLRGTVRLDILHIKIETEIMFVSENPVRVEGDYVIGRKGSKVNLGGIVHNN